MKRMRECGALAVLFLVTGAGWPVPVAAEDARRVDALGDPLPDGVLLRIGTNRLRHDAPIHSMAFSPDGRILYSRGEEGALYAWEVPSGRPRFVIRESMESGSGFALSPDGSKLVAPCGDRKLRVWRADTGDAEREIEAQSDLNGVAFTPDGKHLLAMGAQGTLFIIDAASGELRRPLKAHEETVNRVACSPDGRRMYTVSDDKTVRAWDPSTGTLLGTWKGHEASVMSVAVSPEGRRVVTGDADGRLIQWDEASGKAARTFDLENADVLSVSFTPDGRHLVAVTDEALHVLDAVNWQRIQILTDLSQGARDAVFTRDGKLLAAGGNDRRILFWTVERGRLMKERRVGRFAEGISNIEASPDGRTAAVFEPSAGIHLWDLAEDRELRRLEWKHDGIPRMAFSPDGRLLAAADEDKSLYLWAAGTGELVRTLEGPDGHFQAMVFVPGGTRLLTFDAAGNFTTWDTGTGARVTEGPDATTAQADSSIGSGPFTLSPDGKTLVTIASSGSMIAWEMPSLKRQRRLEKHEQNVTAIAFSPDGRRMVSGDSDGTLCIWDTATWTCLRTQPRTDMAAGLVAVTFCPDGTSFLTMSSENEASWSLWSLDRPDPPTVFPHCNFDPQCWTRLPGGRIMTSRRSTASIWELGEGVLCRAMRLPGSRDPFTSVAFTSDGRRLVATVQDENTHAASIHLLDAGTGEKNAEMKCEHGQPLAVVCPLRGDRVCALTQTGQLRIWSSSGAFLSEHELSQRGVVAFTAAPDGRRVAVSAPTGELTLWDEGSGETRVLSATTPGDPLSPATSLVFTPDGRALHVLRQDRSVEVWDVAKASRTRLSHSDQAEGIMTFMPGGGTALSAEAENAERTILVEMATGKKAAGMEPGDGMLAIPSVRADGALVALSSTMGGISLWEPWTGKRLHVFEGSEGVVSQMVFSPDGRRLATVCGDATILIWDVSAWAGPTLPAESLPPVQMEEAWRTLAQNDPDACEAYRAMARLVGSGDAAVRFLSNRLAPAPAPPRTLAQRLRELDDDDVEVREKAMAGLLDLGFDAEPALREAKNHVTSAEVVTRLDRVLSELGSRPRSGEVLRRLRAVRTIGRIGTPEARKALEAVFERALYRDEMEEARAALVQMKP